MQNKLLTIGITSYSRPYELKRLLESIDCKYEDLIEIVVSEDNSPKREEIKVVIENFKRESKFLVRENYNKVNLGYDRNLKKLMDLSESKYILYMSDDDKFIEGALDKLINFIQGVDVGVIYSPFYEEEFHKYTRSYKTSFEINSGSNYINNHIYDSILFSGLIFNRNLLNTIDAERFLNKNYFQVYLFMYAIHNYGGFYHNEPLVYCVGDGENGYGLSDSSTKNELLANRKSYLSNLEFHKGLIDVIKMFDDDYATNYFKYFENEYNLRTVTGFSKAASLGKNELKKYWEKLNTLDIKIQFKARVFYFLFYIFPAKMIISFMNNIKTLFLKYRGIKK